MAEITSAELSQTEVALLEANKISTSESWFLKVNLVSYGNYNFWSAIEKGENMAEKISDADLRPSYIWRGCIYCISNSGEVTKFIFRADGELESVTKEEDSLLCYNAFEFMSSETEIEYQGKAKEICHVYYFMFNNLQENIVYYSTNDGDYVGVFTTGNFEDKLIYTAEEFSDRVSDYLELNGTYLYGFLKDPTRYIYTGDRMVIIDRYRDPSEKNDITRNNIIIAVAAVLAVVLIFVKFRKYLKKAFLSTGQHYKKNGMR